MKAIKKYKVLSFVLLLALSVLLLNNCGKEAGDVSAGCNGGYWAVSTDSIVGPADATLSTGPTNTSYSIGYSPLVFTVFDKNKNPKNKVCVDFYTDGFYYTTGSYLVVNPGTGPINHITGVTDASGTITLFWMTESLPVSNPSVSTTPGADISGDSWVQAYSKAIGDTYTVSWTVLGWKPAP